MAQSLQTVECESCGAEYTVDFGEQEPSPILYCGVCGDEIEDADLDDVEVIDDGFDLFSTDDDA